MTEYLFPLLQLQRFYLPTVLVLLVWAIWRTVWRQDLAVGLALYLGLVIVVDGFMNTGLFIPGLDKGSIRYSEVCAVFLLLHRPPATSGQASRRTVLVLVAAYFTLLFASAMRADSMVAGIFEFRSIIVPQIVALLVAMRGLATPADYRRFVLHVTALVLIIALFDFFDIFFDRWLLHSESLLTGKYFVNRNQGRFGSLFLNPNMLGAFTVLVFPVMFIWTLNEPSRWRRLYGWSGLLALVFCLVETQSRGPLIAFGIGLLILAIGPCGGVSRTRRLGFLAALVILFTACMPGFYDHAIQRFDEIDKEMATDEARTRANVWVYARRAIADHPVLGIGFGEQQFLTSMDAYGFREKYGEASLDNPHNSYLQMAVYAGIPVLAAFLLANLVLLWKAGRASWRRADDQTAHTVFALAVSNAGFLGTVYPDMHLFTRDVGPVYWVFFGLLLAVAIRPSKAPAEAKGTIEVSAAPSPARSALTFQGSWRAEGGMQPTAKAGPAIRGRGRTEAFEARSD